MKVLFTALYPMWHYHFTTEMEIVQHHLGKGDDVTIVECNAALKSCECNPNHELFHCARCIGIRQDGISLLDANVKTLPWPKEHPWLPWDLRTSFTSGFELRDYRYKDFDLGAAVFSSLVDRTRNTNPNPEDHKETTRNIIEDTYKCYKFAHDELTKNKYDCVYIFNGRFATARPWIRVCLKLGINFRTHERSGATKNYFVFENSVPHEPTQYARLIMDFWNGHGKDADVYKEGVEYFEERVRGQISSWYSFTKDQVASMLPDNWDRSKRNMAIFSSTEGEYSGLAGIFISRLFDTQLEGVLTFCKLLRADPSIHLYLRIHPNSIRENFQWWLEPELSKQSNLTIVLPDSKVSSYAMLHAAEKIIVFSSTMGIEATYHQKPSILARECFYRGIGAIYEPNTVDELISDIKATLTPKPKERAIAYGAFWRCSGHPYRYSKPLNYYTLSFKDKVLEASRPVHEWLGKCEARPPLTGLRKTWQDWQDEKALTELKKNCDNWFAESPRNHGAASG